jgi:hypothetical protein
MTIARSCVAFVLLLIAAPVAAQSAVPSGVRFVGTLPTPGVRSTVTFALYENEAGGTALWTETQEVATDASGRYGVVLGAGSPEGLPASLFASGAPRWLGVRLADGVELPRAALLSVPYAAKAADAETIGGKPMSAFLLAGDKTGTGTDGLTYVNPAALELALSRTAGSAGPSGGAAASTLNRLPRFADGAGSLADSILYQDTLSLLTPNYVGVNTTAPQAQLHVLSTAAPGALVDVVTDSLGAVPLVHRAARGTPGSPAAVHTDDILGGVAARGYTGAAWSGGRAQMMFRAAENWAGSANGTYMQFATTPIGGNVWTERLRVDPSGNVGIGTTAPAQKLSVAGTIESTSGGIRFPDGSVQSSAAPGRSTTSVTIVGMGAGNVGMTGDWNSAFGAYALTSTTTGYSNSAFGQSSLRSNISGARNSAVGVNALYTNSAGDDNAAIGVAALFSNTVGARNVGVGNFTLWSNQSGINNTAIGHYSLEGLRGDRNVGVGALSLPSTGNGADNIAVGFRSLNTLTAGDGNVAIGSYAGQHTASGSRNVYIGQSAGPDSGHGNLTNAVAIGANAVVNQSNTVVLGGTGADAVVVGIGTATPNGSFALDVIGSGRFSTVFATCGVFGGTSYGTCPSDARFKQDVRAFGPVLDRVSRLEPVRFTWRASEFPARGFDSTVNIGLIAQDVERVLPEMVTTDADGYKRVNYGELPYLTLAAVKELKGENDALKARIAALEAGQQARLTALEQAQRDLLAALARLERSAQSPGGATALSGGVR